MSLSRLFLILILLTFGGIDPSGATAIRTKTKRLKSKTQFELSLGTPSLLRFALYRPISKKWQAGLSLGLIPGGLFSQSLGGGEEQEVNSRYSMVTYPSANIVSSGAVVKYRPWLKRSFFEFNYTLLIVNAGGRSALKSNTNAEQTPVSEVDVTLVQSLLGANYGYDFYKSKNLRANFYVGLSYRFPAFIKSRVRGGLPAFLDVAPEYRATVVDGTEEVIDHVSTDLDNLFNSYRWIPNIGISLNW